MLRPGARIVGIDDGPFERTPHSRVRIIAVLVRGAGRVDGIMSSHVTRDGFGATAAIVRMLRDGRFARQAQAVLTDGLAVGGFNMIDLPKLAEELRVPAIAVMRKAPNLEAIRQAMQHTSQAARRWRTLERAGPIHAADGLWFQVEGATAEVARGILRLSIADGSYPEALRLAHLIAGGLVTGASRGRA